MECLISLKGDRLCGIDVYKIRGGTLALNVIAIENALMASFTKTYSYDHTHEIIAIGSLDGSGHTGYYTEKKISNGTVTTVHDYSYITITVDTTNHTITVSDTYSGHFVSIVVVEAV